MIQMSDLKILSNELMSYAGEMAPFIVEKAFRDVKLQGDKIPPTMRKKVVDIILDRIVFDQEKHQALRRELMNSLRNTIY